MAGILDGIKAKLADYAGYNQTVAEPMGAIADKQRMIDQYKQAVSPQATQPLIAPVQKPHPVVNPSNMYGTRPGEQRIDVSEWVKPLGGGLQGVRRK